MLHKFQEINQRNKAIARISSRGGQKKKKIKFFDVLKHHEIQKNI